MRYSRTKDDVRSFVGELLQQFIQIQSNQKDFHIKRCAIINECRYPSLTYCFGFFFESQCARFRKLRFQKQSS